MEIDIEEQIQIEFDSVSITSVKYCPQLVLNKQKTSKTDGGLN